MLNHSDCDFRMTSYAREIARVNTDGWMCPALVGITRTSMLVRLGSAMVALSASRVLRAPEASHR